MRRTLSILLAVLLLCTGCGKKTASAPLRVDLESLPLTLDPQFAPAGDATVLVNLFEGLVKLSPDGAVLPAAAERWEISPHHDRYTFTLRQGLRWSNGEPVTAADFVYAFRRLFDPSAPSPHAKSYLAIANAAAVLAGEASLEQLGVTAPDDQTVVFSLATKQPDFLSLLGLPPAFPCQQAFFLAQKGRYGLSPDTVCTNGAFSLAAKRTDALTLEPAAAYRAPPSLSQLTFYGNRGDPVALFQQGKNDVVRLPFGEASPADATAYYHESWILLFSMDGAVFADRELRGMVAAAAWEEIAGLSLPDVAKRPAGLIAQDVPVRGMPYRELITTVPMPSLPPPSRDVLREKLAAMGQPRIDESRFIVSNFYPGAQLGSLLQKGVKATLSTPMNMEQLSQDTLRQRLYERQFDLAIFPFSLQGTTPQRALAILGELASLPPELAAPFADALERSSRAEDPAVAAAALREAESLLWEEYIALPLFEAPAMLLVGEGVSGVTYNEATHTFDFSAAVRLVK